MDAKLLFLNNMCNLTPTCPSYIIAVLMHCLFENFLAAESIYFILIIVLQEDNLDPGVLTDHRSSNGKSVESFPIESKQLFSRQNCGEPESVKFIKCLFNGLGFSVV